MSTAEHMQGRAPRRRAALTAYVVVAVAARSADAGAIVGIVLLATAHSEPGVAGVLAACLTIPHVSGPLSGRILDRARHPRTVLIAGYAGYAVLLTVAVGCLAAGWMPAAAVALVAAGACGPLVTGGLSSRLTSIVGDESVALRRAQGLDALTYGVAGAAGPAAVAIVAAAVGPEDAVLAASILAALAAAAAFFLPKTASPKPAAAPAPESAQRGVFRLIARVGPLRRTTIGTVGSALATGALPIFATAMASEFNGAAGLGAALVSAFGVGALVGATVLIARPLRGDPERMTRAGVIVVGVLLGACAIPASPWFSLSAFAVTGAANAALFAATLAARNDYSPIEMTGRVFSTVAGIKVAGSSVGVALAGLGAHLGASTLILVGAGVCGVTAAAMTVDAVVSKLSRVRHS